MTNLNLNTNPYYDDYDKDKNFYQILFNPSRAVQSRELTQMQTVLQKQISSMGQHLFKEGAIVKGLEHTLDQDYHYVKLKNLNASAGTLVVASWLGKHIEGVTSGVGAYIMAVADGSEGSSTGEKTFFVKYTKSGTNGVESHFRDGEQLHDTTVGSTLVNAVAIGTHPTTTATGSGSAFTVDEGIIFVRDTFVVMQKQSVVLSRYNTKPSVHVGFLIDEEIVTSNDDATLYDPAQGSPNENAPGADRLKISLTLETRDVDSADLTNFHTLFTLNDGVIDRVFERTDYAEIRKEFARRTFEESGNYTLQPYYIELKEHLNDLTNGGRYKLEEGGDSNKLFANVSAGTAFVNGFEITTIRGTPLDIRKGTDDTFVNAQEVSAAYGSYVICNEVVGNWDLNVGTIIDLRGTAATAAVTAGTYGGTAVAGASIGSARVKAIVYESGTMGAAAGKMRFYLYDIRFSGASAFKNIKTLYYNGTPKYFADPVLESGNAVLYETSISENIFPVIQKDIKRLRDTNGNIDTSFKFQKEFSVSFVAGVCTINTGSSDETFEGTGALSDTIKNRDFIVVSTQTAAPFTTGQVINMLTGSGRSITINSTTQATFDLGAVVAMTGKIVCSLTRSTAKEMAKTLHEDEVVRITDANIGGVNGPWGLSKSDIFILKSVVLDPAGSATDITDNFTLDNGQRDTFYDHGSLVKNKNYSIPGAGTFTIDVTFDYFTQDSSQGVGYFSVDSYPVDDTGVTSGTIKTWEIPTFVSPATGKSFYLREVIDTRPRKLDSSNSYPTANPTDPTTVAALMFDTVSGGIHTLVPNSTITTDLEYYIGRIDKISLNSDGLFSVIEGKPSLIPVPPKDAADAMTLSVITIPPYPSLPAVRAQQYSRPAVAMRMMNNVRYTMSDIGSLERRINSLEYYTSLSLLEKDAADLKILDAAGLDRFKNGIVVDAFTGHNVGDVLNPDYKCSIDPKEKTLRPKFNLDHTLLWWDSTNSTNVTAKSKDVEVNINSGTATGTFVYGEIVKGGTSSATALFEYVAPLAYPLSSPNEHRLYMTNYSGAFTSGETVTGQTSGATGVVSNAARIVVPSNGNLVSLKYDHIILAEQPYASKPRNCVSELLFTYVGNIILTPDTDNWVDTKNNPDLVVNFNGNYDNWASISKAWGTQWGNWATIVTGTQAEESIVAQGTQIDKYTGQGFNQPVLTQQLQLRTTIDTKTKSSREGVQLQVTPDTVTKSLGTKIVDTAVVPYMRSRVIQVHATRLKPNTKVFAFFDSVDVKDWMTLTNSSYTPTSSKGANNLITDSNGELYALFEIPNTTAIKFSSGTKIFRLTDVADNSKSYGSTSAEAPYTAAGLVQTQENTIISTKEAKVTTAKISEEKTGSESSISFKNVGEKNIGLPKITAGTTDIRCIQDRSAGWWWYQSYRSQSLIDASTTFRKNAVNGVYWDDSVILDATDWTNPLQNEHGPSWADWSSPTNPVPNNYTHCQRLIEGNWVDPIAQTFMIDETLGIFLTKLDLFFSSKSSTASIMLQIRNVENGFPGPKVIPYSEVELQPINVNVSDDATVATTFRFSSPVYLSANTEYCFVLLPAGNSPDYEVWVSELGENEIGTTQRISKQPAAGVLFTSSNNRTWTARQAEDIKFTMHRAYFDTNNTGTAIVKNSPRDHWTIASNISKFAIGDTITGGTGSYTAIIEEIDTDNVELTVKNMTGAFIVGETITNTQWLITHANAQSGKSYVIGETVTQTTSGAVGRVISTPTDTTMWVQQTNASAFTTTAGHVITGGTNGKVEQPSVATKTTTTISSINNKKVNLIHPNIEHLLFGPTTVGLTTKTTSSAYSIDGSFSTMRNDADNYLTTQQIVASRSNEIASMASVYSLQHEKLITSSENQVSPVIDTSRMGDIIVENIINTADVLLAFSGVTGTFTVGETVTQAVTSATGTVEYYDSASKKLYVNSLTNTFTSTNNSVTGGSSGAVGTYPTVSFETSASGGPAFAKYITRRVVLNDGFDAEDIKIFITASKPTTSSIDIYYKILNRDDGTNFDDRTYVKMDLSTTKVPPATTLGANTFIEYEYAVPLAQKVGGVDTGAVQYSQGGTTFITFKTFAIKIVMTSTDTSSVPVIKNFRSIALSI